MSERVEALARAAAAAWAAHDSVALGELLADGCVYEDPLSAGPLRGAPAIGEHAERIWEGFPDGRVESAGTLHAGTAGLATTLRFLGTHRGPLGELPATGKFVIVPAALHCELDGGRVVRARLYFDLYDAAVQLGVLPARGTVGEKALLLLRGFGLRASGV